jgi:hypothetical protein
MRTHNPANERIKREYFTYLKEAKRYSDASLDGVAKALSRFEAYTRPRTSRPSTSSRRPSLSGISPSR